MPRLLSVAIAKKTSLKRLIVGLRDMTRALISHTNGENDRSGGTDTTNPSKLEESLYSKNHQQDISSSFGDVSSKAYIPTHFRCCMLTCPTVCHGPPRASVNTDRYTQHAASDSFYSTSRCVLEVFRARCRCLCNPDCRRRSGICTGCYKGRDQLECGL